MESAVDVEVECDGDSDIIAAGQDFNKIARIQTKAGFSDGSLAGHAEGVEEGFLAGLETGFKTALHYGRLRGSIQALLTLCGPGSEPSAELKELLKELETKAHSNKQLPVEGIHTSSASGQCVRDVAESECGEELRAVSSRVDKLREQIMSSVCSASN